MSTETSFHALEAAMERSTALKAELSEKIPPDERGGRFLRAFELLDLLEHSLLQLAKEMKDIK